MSTYESQQQYPEPPVLGHPTRGRNESGDDRREAMREILEAFKDGRIDVDLMLEMIDVYADGPQRRQPPHNAMAAGMSNPVRHIVGSHRRGYSPMQGGR